MYEKFMSLFSIIVRRTKALGWKLAAIFVVFIIAVVGIFLVYRDSGVPRYEFVEAVRKDLTGEVSVTGRVQPIEDVELSFEKASRVSSVRVRVGSMVVRGSVLAELDNGDLRANLAQADADVKAEEAKLAELKRGTRQEEIEIARAEVLAAEVAFSEAQNNFADKINDSFTKSDDVVRNKVDQFFTNPRSPYPRLNFETDTQLKNKLEFTRLVVENMLVRWQTNLENISSAGALDAQGKEARENLTTIKSFLEDIARAVNALTPTTGLSQTTVDSYKSDVSIARTNINTALSNLQAADEKLKTAQSNKILKEEGLKLKQAGRTQEEIAAQEARLLGVRAKADSIRVEIAKTILITPISGIVTKNNLKVGEIAEVRVPAISVIGEGGFEVIANVPESDIAALEKGHPARVTLDAYTSDDIFFAHIIRIDPAETIIDGVATYEIRLAFDKPDPRIRSGMTANIDIITGRRENVIVVPERAVVRKNGGKIVRTIDDAGSVHEVFVETGLSGSDGNVEILSGITEGDQVIIFERE
ncbi:MAG: RND family efflux transporter MFP subunit [Parcubacteria group bacterium GW2011_GWA2_47_10b]|nr:MAG: RND family efflux transporter MFP subunit [Parcubacteria group bacterium GW2011_GWA2_47_10b]KKU85169.1 MAG: RND family efflux transporter MFP subunit [Parcubacteria group bacterium GW2011_GWA1_47_9]OGZ52567.1 MAG: hypothetical protein A3A29_01370 [Candidatus Ryanbacteria bacterium RIFCSPLOWO2_01_FULL_47_79]